MRILLDEMLPVGLRDLLPEHDVVTAAYAGLAGISNGEMLRRPQQQDLNHHGIGLVLIRHNDLDRIRPYVDALRDAVTSAVPGTVIHVTPQG